MPESARREALSEKMIMVQEQSAWALETISALYDVYPFVLVLIALAYLHTGTEILVPSFAPSALLRWDIGLLPFHPISW